ncbi:LuxR family transcriptional regulator [Streptomyces rapamycinicus]|uniref:LuxR family transcriptional regulator n=2 Tax=Streptomyces rapamycinicus TaxID=1226757 RepID=A0A0A0NN59_STRRN|nr:LuxR family transcriptional regulator [Streptomyces rapamycinicus]AGP57548.1 LuxR family transcriptional regulator [Streptomyces rapamycinicus NRRL 5491]MBB4785208.1 DNA-binding CsgD family transcriptional regulator [Streptomyces rapamycinicus]RLV79320.1 LuxR family transcriptional regulator [Streptomyces rapamycinicus NRRL 5491]UTO65418.1 DNA-binding response regulator [Streptomyces rapamycinicus]UTP33374.1 DNA-binding response regulator [Streptomyces rapamycinicus NRRL 5491]
MMERGRDPGPEAALAGDSLEGTLREVRDLIESTVIQHRARRARDARFTEVGVEDAAFLAAAEEVIGQAGRSVDAVFPECSSRMAPVQAALGALLTDLGEPVGVRMLRGRSAPGPGATGPASGSAPASGPAVGTAQSGPVPRPIPGPAPPAEASGEVPAARPAQVRIASVPLPTAVIADGRTALVCTEAEEGRQTSVIEDPVVVATLYGMFRSIWGGAVPAARPLDFGNRARTEMVRRVLARLRDGVTDEAAARDLAISVRTYRRYVTGILELLEANSRFQAGVRATELGILGNTST